MNCAVCGARAVHRHHVVYRQHLNGADPADDANLLPLCFRCHERHHFAYRRIPLSVLRDENYAFAQGLFGPAAYDYLLRRYGHRGRDRDPRLEFLLEEPNEGKVA